MAFLSDNRSTVSPARSARPGVPPSAADAVHAQLRHEIVAMVRLPGSTIAEKEIAAAHGVSRTPVREALLRLAEERLIEITPKSGTRVSRIPVAALSDAMCAREALELMLIRKAASQARGSSIATLKAIIEHQRECAEAGDNAGFHEADDALHRAIAEAAGHPGVWDMVLQIKVQLDRVRHLTLPRPGRPEHVIPEHELIVDAIADHDVAAATRAMQAHIVSLKDAFGELRHINPDYFDGDIADLEF